MQNILQLVTCTSVTRYINNFNGLDMEMERQPNPPSRLMAFVLEVCGRFGMTRQITLNAKFILQVESIVIV